MKLVLSILPTTLFGLNIVNDDGELVYITKELDLDEDLEVKKTNLLGFIGLIKKNARFGFGKFEFAEQNRRLSALKPEQSADE